MQVSIKQLGARNKLVSAKGGAIWWRVGTGKTRIAISWFALNAKFNGANTFLVVCRRPAFRDWLEEIRKVGLKWRVVELESADQFDFNFIKSKQPTVYLISHGKLAKMREGLCNYAMYFDQVVYDEGFLYKNPQSARCKAAHQVSTLVGESTILSGSMMTARNTEDIYGQLYAIDRHHVIGRTLTDFRSRYRFELKIDGRGASRVPEYRGPRWFNRANSTRAITEAIGDVCSVYFPADNQRGVVEATRICSPSRAQTRAFQELRDYYWLRFGTFELIIKNKPSLIIKCQQISDGWVQMGKKEDGSEGEIMDFADCSKLDYLTGYVEELLDAGERVAIWCAFKHSVRLVLHQMQKAFPGVGAYSLTGGKSFDRSGWDRRGRIFVGTEASGSSVNYLRHCAYAIYYSMDFHWLHLQQSQGRTNRKDSKHDTCYYTFLQTEGSMDDHVLNMVRLSSRKEQELLLNAAVTSWIKRKQ